VGAAAVAFRFALALMFVLSGLAKLPRREEFVGAVRNYRLVPDRVGRVVAQVLPPVEVASGVLLALGLGIRPVAALLALFLVGFSAAIAINLLRGRTIDCGCFGPVGNRRITWLTVGRNLVLVAMAVQVAAVAPTSLALDRVAGLGSHGPSSAVAVALLFTATLAVVGASLGEQAWRALRLAANVEARRAAS
jgi:uncharacterized membrane protein YphA (DoxX/SURF4 family)